MEDEAFHGVLGEFARELDGRIEPDVPAVLVQALVLFGNLIGRRPHRVVAETRHAFNEYAVVVGQTSYARKGTSLELARELIRRAADEKWIEQSLSLGGGISSGEGLLESVCEPEDLPGQDGKSSRSVMRGRRRCVVESELSRVLAVGKRDGSTTSGWLRNLWDRGIAQNSTRRSPLQVQDAHFSMIGHVTLQELRARFDTIDIANGMGNRVLWVAARRAAYFHDGGGALRAVYDRFAPRLQTCVERAREWDELRWSEQAEEVYRSVYPIMESEPPAPSASTQLTARSAAHVLRLSGIYACLASGRTSPIVRVPDLLAALAVLKYVGDSVNYIWGGRLLDPLGQRIVEALSEGPRTLTDLHGALHRNVQAAQLHEAIDRLVQAGQVSSEPIGSRGKSLSLVSADSRPRLVRPLADALDRARELAVGADDESPPAEPEAGGSPLLSMDDNRGDWEEWLS